MTTYHGARWRMAVAEAATAWFSNPARAGDGVSIHIYIRALDAIEHDYNAERSVSAARAAMFRDLYRAEILRAESVPPWGRYS